MQIAREVERRLERLVERVAGSVFRGELHPLELASRLVREADLALQEGPAGPVAPNVFRVRYGSRPDEPLPPTIGNELASAVELTAAAEGWRLEGPVAVDVEPTADLPPATVKLSTSTEAGPLAPWALLAGSSMNLDVKFNRNLVGRSRQVDIRVDSPSVSRTHALLWRERGRVHVRDLSSSNGTTIDGRQLDDTGSVYKGSVLTFGVESFTFRAPS